MEKSKRRVIDLLVLSDIHLGTFGCKAKELLKYLKSIQPKILVLNGDIIDMWQFNKHYFPTAHMKIIKHITSLLTEGTKVYYITGNHDEMLRKFKNFSLGGFEIVNKVVLELDGKQAWFFHGDVFDVTMKHSKWLGKLGSVGYDFLIVVNMFVNWISEGLGYGRLSFSKRVKESVKGAINHINNFEETVSDLAIYNQYDYVICGHIHQPKIKKITNNKGQKVMYLNSGDWIENLTALEYHNQKWSLYEYYADAVAQTETKKTSPQEDGLHRKKLFNDLVEEFQY